MGNEPSQYSYRGLTGDKEIDRKALREAAALMREHGATWFRATAVDDDSSPVGEGVAPVGFWLEGWDARPKTEPKFNPPLTYADTK